jgi:hypothetical protein
MGENDPIYHGKFLAEKMNDIGFPNLPIYLVS